VHAKGIFAPSVIHMRRVIPLITILQDIFIKFSKMRAGKLGFAHYTLSGDKSVRHASLKSTDGTVVSLKKKKRLVKCGNSYADLLDVGKILFLDQSIIRHRKENIVGTYMVRLKMLLYS
jgi:hypothetical protein